MSSKGYARFTDSESDEDDADIGVRTNESSIPPSGEVPVNYDIPPAEQKDIQLESGAGEELDLDLAVRSGEQIDEGADGGDGEQRSRVGDEGNIDNEGITEDTQIVGSSQGCWASFNDLIRSNAVLLYISQALSAWGDRMWSFAVSLYLVEIEDQSLRLTAVYGLCISASSLVFGAAIGRWVDKTPRLRAARLSLVIQNSCVLVNAGLLVTVLLLKDTILAYWGGALYLICQLSVILLGTLASLASLAEQICIQKDWVVVVAGNDKEVLASLNATMRRIDLVSNILAPIVVGAIMTASMLIGGIFIAAWNAGSMVIEYWNLWRVYKNVPALARKGGVEFPEEQSVQAADGEVATYAEMAEPSPPELRGQQTNDLSQRSSGDGITEEDREFTEIPVTPKPVIASSSAPADAETQTARSCSNCCQRVVTKFKHMFEGWLVYKSYEEFWAGLGLAFLYMTVLGFDSITIGFGYSQGVPEFAIGMLQALGSITGILGTVLYPFMRRRIGLERAGLYSLGIQFTFLLLCLASVWAPGSPFIYDYSANSTATMTTTAPPLTSIGTRPSVYPTSPGVPPVNTTDAPNDAAAQCLYTGTEEQQTSYWSVGLLYAGIVLSRIGLWSYDLVTTQLIQEHVRETERGAFNGVQRALECSFDMLHFILVIALPCPETMGYLIILSNIFIGIGAASYAIYSYKRRGHLIHMEKMAPCLKNGSV